MERLKVTGLMMLALVFTPLTSMAASPLASNFSCASTGGVNSDGKGNVWIGGSKAMVEAFNENYWEAKSGSDTVSISRRDDGDPDVSWGGLNREHEICLPEGSIDLSGAKKSTSTGPSFSCAAVAKGSIEGSTCQSPSLSEMDLALNGAYRQALTRSNNGPALKVEQCGWMKGRNRYWKEQDESACIAHSYSGRMAELHNKWGVK